MDWVRLGRGFRALRLRRGWRQADVARVARCSQALVSSVERGRGDRVTPRTLERLAAALDARLVVRLDWNGEALDRFLDSVHAALVELVLARLRGAGWEGVPEATFAVFGERGSIDILAWHPPTRTLLVVEVKSIVPDAQEALSTLDRKTRLAPAIGAARGWRPATVARLLVIGDTRTSRRRVEALRSTFDAAFPDRVAAVRRFLAAPAGALSGLMFLPVSSQARTRHRMARPRLRR